MTRMSYQSLRQKVPVANGSSTLHGTPEGSFRYPLMPLEFEPGGSQSGLNSWAAVIG